MLARITGKADFLTLALRFLSFLLLIWLQTALGHDEGLLHIHIALARTLRHHDRRSRREKQDLKTSIFVALLTTPALFMNQLLLKSQLKRCITTDTKNMGTVLFNHHKIILPLLLMHRVSE